MEPDKEDILLLTVIKKNKILFATIIILLFIIAALSAVSGILPFLERTLGINIDQNVNKLFFIAIMLIASILFIRFFLIFKLEEYKKTFENRTETIESEFNEKLKREIENSHARGVEDAFKCKRELYEPLITACHKFICHFEEKELNSIGKEIVNKFSELPDSWLKYFKASVTRLPVEHKNCWEELAKATAIRYFDATTKVRNGEHGVPLLLSNFNIYAECVCSILDTLLKSTIEFGNTVIVWTLFDKTLPNWYNMVSVSRGKYYCTQNWWEKYKKQIADLKYNDKIQMRRLVVDKKEMSSENHEIPNESLQIYKGESLSVAEAKNISAHISKNFHFIDNVGNILNSSFDLDSEKIFLIGYFEDSSTRSNGEWKSLKNHFIDTYHTSRRHIITREAKGVYFKDIQDKCIMNNSELSAYLDYDDIFLVEFSENEGKVDGFGIALNIDEKKDTVGISLLSGNELNMTRKAFFAKWE